MSLRMHANFFDVSKFWKVFEFDDDFMYKPISVFCDHPADDYHLSLNPINILMIMEPNEFFGLHDYAIKEGHKYNVILTWSKKVLDNCDNAIEFPFGVSWVDGEFIDEMKTKEKTFEISYLCGANKKIDGHFRRHRIFDRKDEVKIPKKFWMTLPDFDHNTGKVMDMSGKNVVWEDSMFSLCMENSTHHGYFTEKVLDAFLTRTVPVYWGCKDLDKYFDSRGFIKCETEDEIIEKINNLTEEDYHSRKEYIDKNFKLAQHYADIVLRLKNWLTDLIKLNKVKDSEFNGQFLEDKWIIENIELPEKGFFVDVGGCYPRFINNTYYFEKTLNWDGISIEPDPTYANLLRKERINVEEVAISPIKDKTKFKIKSNVVDDTYDGDDVIEVKTSTLNDILEKYEVDEIDIISIDLEGYEMEAWKTFDVKKYKPKLIITEHTEMGNYNDEFTKHILEDIEYRVVHQTPINFVIAHSSVKLKNNS